VIEQQGVIENVAPIQLGIRLLIPEGSRMLDWRRCVAWLAVRSAVAGLLLEKRRPAPGRSQRTVQEIAAAAERQKESRPATFERIWKAAHTAAGLPAPQINPPPRSQAGVPFLSEPWYCCAEPTRDQLVSIGAQKPLVKNAVASADGFV